MAQFDSDVHWRRAGCLDPVVAFQSDRIPLIFKRFSRAGYLTTYIENMPKFGLWTYHQKNGFDQQPTEYYVRPVNLRVYQELNHWFCYKERLEMEVR